MKRLRSISVAASWTAVIIPWVVALGAIVLFGVWGIPPHDPDDRTKIIHQKHNVGPALAGLADLDWPPDGPTYLIIDREPVCLMDWDVFSILAPAFCEMAAAYEVGDER